MKRILVSVALAWLLYGCQGSDQYILEPGMAVDAEIVFGTTLPWDSDAKGTMRTMSGLEFRRIRKGQGDTSTPSYNDVLTVDYEGRLITGEVFDSSYARGKKINFSLNEVIEGWTEGLTHMQAGDVFLFYIPSDLAYGENPPPGSPIKPNDDLIFLVELHSFEPRPASAQSDEEAWEAYYPWDSRLSVVNKTGSGLEYIILESGEDSGKSPAEDDLVVMHYEARYADSGEVFDSSFRAFEPVKFVVAGLSIQGWREALQLMKEGDRWLVYVPASLAYGEIGTPGGPIPPNADLMFEFALIEVNERQLETQDLVKPESYLPWDSERDGVISTGSGVEYLIIESGDESGPSPVSNEIVVVHYEGRFADTGAMFDSSFERNVPSRFPADGLIPGWVEVLKLMKPGDYWVVYIPSVLAYGEEGAGQGEIPPNADLVFEIQMIDVLRVD